MTNNNPDPPDPTNTSQNGEPNKAVGKSLKTMSLEQEGSVDGAGPDIEDDTSQTKTQLLNGRLIRFHCNIYLLY